MLLRCMVYSYAWRAVGIVSRTEPDMLYMALVLSCVSRQLAMPALDRTCSRESLSNQLWSRASGRESSWMAWSGADFRDVREKVKEE